MILFFDVSAEGKPKNWKAGPNDAFSWPRLVHLSWLLYDDNRELVASRDDLIKPEGFEISQDTERIHKIDPVKIHEEGTPIKEALQQFSDVVDKAEYIVSYNSKFNSHVVAAEFYRKGMSHRMFSSELYCLMQEATWYVKKPKPGGGYKWPKLMEIHQKLYDGKLYADANNALADVSVVALLFYNLLDLEAIELF